MKREKKELQVRNILLRRGKLVAGFVGAMGLMLVWSAFAPGQGGGDRMVDASAYLTPNPDTPVSASAANSEFFSQYRMDRQKSRSEELEYLNTHILSDAAASADEKEKARTRILEITDNIETELIAENLIRTKGYPDALVFIHEGGVNVVVAQDSLTEMDVARISAIIQEVSTVAPGSIVVSVDKSL